MANETTATTQQPDQYGFYTCGSCRGEKPGTGRAHQMYNLRGHGLSVLEMVVCGKCKSAAEEAGYQAYRLSGTLAMLARQEHERQAQEDRQAQERLDFFQNLKVHGATRQQPAKARRQDDQADQDRRSQGWEQMRAVGAGTSGQNGYHA